MSRRPSSLAEVAQQSESLADFGRNLRDWLHHLRGVSSWIQAAAAIAVEPPLLRDTFIQGDVADAWLAAYAEHLAAKAGIPAPAWAFRPARFLPEPSFDEAGASPALRALALVQSPLAFKRRNLFTPAVDLPLALRAGRPTKPAEEKRRKNAERQRRFRAARKRELALLRPLTRGKCAA
jgi:hypothetical protein